MNFSPCTPSSPRVEFAIFSWNKGKASAEPRFSWAQPEGFFSHFSQAGSDSWMQRRKARTNWCRCKTRRGISPHGSSLLPAWLQNPGSIPNPGIYPLLITVEMFKCLAGWDSGGIFSFCGAFGNPREGFFILGHGTGTSRMGEIQGGSPGSPGEGKSLE